MNKEDYNKYYIQGSDHYLIPKDVFKELFNEMINWKEEAKELKKQLEEIYKFKFSYRKDETKIPHIIRKQKDVEIIKNLENQQKEFIEYLENEKDRLAIECSQIYEDSLDKTKLVNEDIFNEVDTILSKYKEIIGVPIVGLDALE